MYIDQTNKQIRIKAKKWKLGQPDQSKPATIKREREEWWCVLAWLVSVHSFIPYIRWTNIICCTYICITYMQHIQSLTDKTVQRSQPRHTEQQSQTPLIFVCGVKIVKVFWPRTTTHGRVSVYARARARSLARARLCVSSTFAATIGAVRGARENGASTIDTRVYTSHPTMRTRSRRYIGWNPWDNHFHFTLAFHSAATIPYVILFFTSI